MTPHNYRYKVTNEAFTRYLIKIDQVRQEIMPESIQALTITFENVEQLAIAPAAIHKFLVIPDRASATEEGTSIKGFFLQLNRDPGAYQLLTDFGGEKQRETTARDRLLEYGDISSLSVVTTQGKREYQVDWHPASQMDNQNLSQHCTIQEDYLNILSLLPTQYAVGDLLAAANKPLVSQTMVQELIDHAPGIDRNQAVKLLRNMLDELSSHQDFLEPADGSYVEVQRRDQRCAWGHVQPYATTLYDAVGNLRDELAVSQFTFPQALSIPVELPIHDFWAAFAWYLYDLAWPGVGALERAHRIQQTVAKRLDDQHDSYHVAQEQMAYIQRFLADFQARHMTDPNAVEVVGEYLPLTQGKTIDLLGDGRQTVQLPLLDQGLLDHFFKEFGPAYTLFINQD